MKLLIFCIALIALKNREYVSGEHVDSKVVNVYDKCGIDTGIVEKQLPLYLAVPCVDNLLKQIAKANHKFYDSKKYFYSLSFKKEGEKRYLVIEAVQYKSSTAVDYIGAIKVPGAIFLCRGDISTDTLFKLIDNDHLNVSLKSARDSNVYNYGMEPTLSGLYHCDKIIMELEIYTRAILPGYRMEEVKSKKTGN
jgi:hypothetical protein